MPMVNYIVENFLSKTEENNIESLTKSANFNWNFTPNIIPGSKEIWHGTVIERGTNPFQMVHRFDVNKTNFQNIVSPIFNFLAKEFNSDIQILKSKFNLLHKSNDDMHHYPHLDVDEPDAVYSSIYYVNDSDGDTYFFSDNGEILYTVTPSKGKMVIFDSNKFHASSSPLKNDYRIVLNIVFKLRESI